MNQKEYTRFYNSMRAYARKEASNYFHTAGEIDTATDKAMDNVEDILMSKDTNHPVAYIKTAIRNTIKRLSLKRVEEPRAINTRLDQIKGKSEYAIMSLYVEGLTQAEIIEQLGYKSNAFVSRTIKKYIVSFKPEEVL